LTKNELEEAVSILFSNIHGNYDAVDSYLENYSIEELEEISTHLYENNEKYKEEDMWSLFGDILLKRRQKIDKSFVWTEENKRKFLKANDELMLAFENAYNEAIAQAEILEDRINNNDPLVKDYKIEITISPYAWVKNKDKDGYTFTNVLCEPLNEAELIHDNFSYGIEQQWSIYLDRSTNWNFEYIKGVFPDDVYIGYSIHWLLDNHWSLTDIVNIYMVWADVKVTKQFYKEFL
jgi:hypothetical protein